MKLLALHDKSGRIVAAVRHTGDYKGPVPVGGKGTTLVKLEIPEAHYKLSLAELCTRLRVDTRTSKLVEAKSKAKSTR